MLSLGQYMKMNGYAGHTSFLTTFIHQTQAFINDEAVLDFLDKNPGESTNVIKNSVYKKYFRVRNRKKMTGFEKLIEKDNFYRNELKKLVGDEETVVNKLIGSLDSPPFFEEDRKNFLEACIDAAIFHKQEADKLGKKIYVCMSGGLDSEVTALSFKLAEIDFIPFIVDYKGANDYDTAYAIVWCAENKITPIVHVLDIEKFFETEMFDYAQKTKVTSPQLLTYQKILDIVCQQYNGYAVMGGEIRAFANVDKDVIASYAWDKGETHSGFHIFGGYFNYQEK